MLQHRHGFLFLFLILNIKYAFSIQCYSCKGSGPNEVEANIRCLETAYLENCDDFYQYYQEVENAKVLSYEYYYYGDDGLDYSDEEDDGDNDNGDNKVDKSDDDEYDDDEYYYDYEDESRKKRNVWKPDAMETVVSNIVAQERTKRNTKTTKKLNKKAEVKRGNEEDEIEYEYEYEEVDEYDDYQSNNSSSATTPASVTEPSDDLVRPSPTMPKEPEHFCYSETKKDKWESYHVEKGCKKITYCQDHLENRPEWGKPWNFCCDRSRCNAKLVKDKPQRIFGMGCRRTDDCIQGYNSRPVCPNFFQSCPRLSTSLIKMECRVKSKTMASVKSGVRFQHMFREKKCYCAKGYFPRGPICTSQSIPVTTTSLLTILIGIIFTVLCF